MATAEQIKSLIRSYSSDDKEHFYSIALQVAAHEAKQGHIALANEIRALLDEQRLSERRALKVLPFPTDLKGLILTEEPKILKASLVMEEGIAKSISRVIQEYFQRGKLNAHGLSHRRKILLVGPPGTGKTMTAKVLAHELHLPLHTIQVDRLVTKFMGETSAKLRQIFDLMKKENGVYFFDEFDAIGGDRSLDNDVGEMRRVLNAFLQFIEQDQSDSMIIGATNNPQILDNALFRRFDDVLSYKLPELEQRKQLIKNILGVFMGSKFAWTKVLQACHGMSYSEIDSACLDAIKGAILADKKKINAADLLESLAHRYIAHSSI